MNIFLELYLKAPKELQKTRKMLTIIYSIVLSFVFFICFFS